MRLRSYAVASTVGASELETKDLGGQLCSSCGRYLGLRRRSRRESFASCRGDLREGSKAARQSEVAGLTMWMYGLLESARHVSENREHATGGRKPETALCYGPVCSELEDVGYCSPLPSEPLRCVSARVQAQEAGALIACEYGTSDVECKVWHSEIQVQLMLLLMADTTGHRHFINMKNGNSKTNADAQQS